MNKYSKTKIMLGKNEIDRANVCFIPKEVDGRFQTHDGTVVLDV